MALCALHVNLVAIRIGGWSTIKMVRPYAKVNVIKIAPKVREALAQRTGGTIRPIQ